MPIRNRHQYVKEFTKRRQTNGMCIRCKNPARPGKNLCARCAALSCAREKRRREKRLALGLCCKCDNPSINGTTCCAKHLVQAQNHSNKYREKKINSGHCMYCDKPNVPGKLCCKYHRELAAKRSKDQRNANIKNGLCPCGRERRPGATRCQRCLDRHNYEAKYRAYGGNRIKALERDGHKCRICKDSDRRMTVHHIDGNGSTSKHQNNDLDNLVTLCLRCHNAFTTLCQNGNNVSLAIYLLTLYQNR